MDLIDCLASHRTLASVPRAQLEWLATHGHLRVLDVGDVLTAGGRPVAGLYIVLSGLLSISVQRAAGPCKVMEWHGGDITGVLPYSRISSPPGNVVAEQPTEILMIDRNLMPQIVCDCPELTEVLVHVMLDRARAFKAADLNDEKMMSLGRLAAGLAHELNNPASAAARSASTLVAQLATFDSSAKAFCALPLTGTQRDAVASLRNDTLTPTPGRTHSPIELADREDMIAAWFDKQGVTGCDPMSLAESPLTTANLDQLTATLDRTQIGPVIHSGRPA